MSPMLNLPGLNKPQLRRLATAVLITLCGALGAAAYAAPGGIPGPGGGGPPGGGPGGGNQPPGESAGSNVSFPVILSDNVAPAGFPADGVWRFAAITDPATQCVQESGVAPGAPVDTSIPCYFGRHVSVNSETGAISFDGSAKIWWLQKRPANFWKALSVGHDITTPLDVSAVDVGDLLESSPSIATRQIRTEFNMLQSIAADDPEFGKYLVTNWSGGGVPSPCTMPSSTSTELSIGCFAAVSMSGPVPGTQQSINEAQGADFGPGGMNYPGTQTLVDPTTVRIATLADGTTKIPIHAIVYSNCARLLIQKIEGTPTWDPATGQWSGSGVGAPVVNVSAYAGTYSAEINSGGGLVYGYNWNAKTAATGTYRLTFVLDGNDAEGPVCPTTLGTRFASSVTKLVNVGTANPSHIIYAGDSQLGDEGGLVYVDIALTTKGGGGANGGRRGP